MLHTQHAVNLGFEGRALWGRDDTRGATFLGPTCLPDPQEWGSGYQDWSYLA